MWLTYALATVLRQVQLVPGIPEAWGSSYYSQPVCKDSPVWLVPGSFCGLCPLQLQLQPVCKDSPGSACPPGLPAAHIHLGYSCKPQHSLAQEMPVAAAYFKLQPQADCQRSPTEACRQDSTCSGWLAPAPVALTQKPSNTAYKGEAPTQGHSKTQRDCCFA